jgi:hypothetical protein
MSAATAVRLFLLGTLVSAAVLLAARPAPAQTGKTSSGADEKVVLPVVLPEFQSAAKTRGYPEWLPANLPLPPGTPVWLPEAVVGIAASLLFSALVILTAWPLPKLPPKALQAENDQFCAEFLALPQKIQAIFYQQLSQGECVLWAGKASSRLCRRNLGLVLFGGFSTLSLIVAYGRATSWDDGLPLAVIFVFAITCFFAYLTLELPGIFMLTDRQAYALYQGSRGEFVFIYPPQQIAPVSVGKAWLVPKAGNVNFGTAKTAAARGQFDGDPGPCGFQRIDDPASIAVLVEAVLKHCASVNRAAWTLSNRVEEPPPAESPAEDTPAEEPRAESAAAGDARAVRPEQMFHFE